MPPPLDVARIDTAASGVDRGTDFDAHGPGVGSWRAVSRCGIAVGFDRGLFAVDRSPNEHLTFGWGVHFCTGAHVARAESRALFEEIVRRGLDLRLTGRPERLEANMFAGIKRMPVALQPR